MFNFQLQQFDILPQTGMKARLRTEAVEKPDTIQRGRTIVPGFSVQTVVNPSIGQSLNNLTRAELDTTTATVAVTYAFTARTLNDLRLNWSRVRGATAFSIDDFGGAVPPSSSLLFPSAVSISDAGFQFLLRGGTNSTLVAGRNVDNLQRQINVVDSLTLIRGSHQLRFGIDYRRLTPVYNSLGYNQSVIYDGVTRIDGPTAGTVLSGTRSPYRFLQAQVRAFRSSRISHHMHKTPIE